MEKTIRNVGLYEKRKSLTRLGQCCGKAASSRGITLVEILVVITAFGIMAAIAAPSIRFGNNPLPDTTNLLASDFKLTRARAMSQTTAYRIRPTSQTSIIVERANSSSCAATTWTGIPGYAEFNSGVRLSAATENGTAVTPSTWSLCYNSRGLADKNLRITLQNTRNSATTVIEVFPGGTVQIQ